MPEPITGELRDAMKRWGWVAEDGMVTFGNCTPPSIDADPVLSIYGSDLDRMCDAIDAIHANLERENAELERENAAIKASVAHAYASGYEYAEQDRDGWVELPKDADGVPIRVGDEVVDELDESTAPRKVTSIHLDNDDWWVYIGGIGRRPGRYRHHHAPTVEDVLLELLDEAEYFHSLEEEREAIAEYAAKLRLAGDAE